MTDETFLEQFSSQYGWRVAPAKRRFRYRKEVNKGMRENHRLALTMKGVINRSLDDLEGLQASDYSTYQIFEDGDLAFKLIDLENIKTSRVGLVPRRGIMSPAYIRLVPNHNDADSRFYAWFFFAVYFNNIFNGMGGGVRQNLTPTDLLEFPIPLPDLATQRQIADFLDRETARLDLLIEKKQRLVTLLGEKLDRTVRAYLSGEADYPNEDQRCSTGIGYLPTAPKHWSVEKVGWRYQIQLGKMLDGAKQTGENLRRYLRVADVQWGKINIDDLPEMDFSPSDRKRFRLQHGDLLVNEGGSYVGRSAVWRSDEQEVFYQKALHRVRPRSAKRDTAEFLYYLMWFATKNGVFIAGGNQTTIDHLTAEAFARYRFAFPNLDEQQHISERLKFEEARNDEVSSKVNASINRLKEYRSALITAAVTGQIDVSTYAKSGETDRRLDVIQEEMGA